MNRPLSTPRRPGLALWCIVGIAVVAGSFVAWRALRSDDPEALLALHHRGVAALYRHEFSTAARVFEELTQRLPDDPEVWFHLALAQLNQGGDAVDLAIESLDRARGLDPDHPHVVFCLGVAHDYLGHAEPAHQAFRRAVELAPWDPDTHYRFGKMLTRIDRHDEALAEMEAAATGNPRLEGAWNALQFLYRRAGRDADAKRALDRFVALKESRRGDARAEKFTNMGRLAEPIVNWAPRGIDPVASSLAVRFADPEEVEASTPFAWVDLDLNGTVELWCGGSRSGRFDCSGQGVRRLGTLDALEGARSFAVGDFDEDGVADLVTATADGIATYVTTEVRGPTLRAGQQLARSGVSMVVLADLDLEGDLDLLVCSEIACPQILINRDRAFAEPSEVSVFLDAVSAGARLWGVVDLDGDAGTELLFGSESQLLVVGNEPQWRFPIAASLEGSVATAADFDGDGTIDLATDRGIRFARERGEPETIPVPSLSGARFLASLDVDLDGDVDLLASTGDQTILVRNQGERSFERDVVGLPAAVGAAIVDADGDGDPDVVLATPNGEVLFLRNLTDPLEATPSHHAVRLTLGGVRERGDRRSNLLGLGATVDVHAGNLRRRAVHQCPGVGAQGLSTLVVGIGPRRGVDVVMVRWTDGVIQAETQVPIDQLHRIDEVQRKSSSCPLLFSWDGSRYRFITDFMGGGGLGFWIGPDEYAPPDPTETVRLAPGALEAIAGEYRLSVMEPMQEACYVDALSLRVVEHAANLEVYPDEMFATSSAVSPDGRALAIDRERRAFPVRATDPAGREVGDLLREVDRVYAAPAALDPLLVGYTRPSAWIVRFGDDFPSTGDVRLFLDGWVEYPYSRVNFAAHQEGRRLEPPTIEWRRSGDDGWTVLVKEAGYPAGMPKTMVVDIADAVRAGATEFRLRTNMEIYWDRIFAAEVLPKSRVTERVVALLGARLRFGGYPREYSDDGALPLIYHYAERDPYLPFRKMNGHLTEIGEVADLVRTVDDAFVVMGAGDELLLRFDATALPELLAGRVRTFLLDTHGYCKDADPLTATPDSVDPLPFSGMSSYPPGPEERAPERSQRTRGWR